MEPEKLVEYAAFVGGVAGTLLAARFVADSKRYAVARVTVRAARSSAGRSAGKAAGNLAGRAAGKAGKAAGKTAASRARR